MVKITDKYYVDADSKNYVLKEKTTIQDEKSENFGKEVFKERGYFTSIESLLEGIIKYNTREFISKAEEKDIKDLVQEIRKQTEYIKSLNLNI
jgi:hypothetical protein